MPTAPLTEALYQLVRKSAGQAALSRFFLLRTKCLDNVSWPLQYRCHTHTSQTALPYNEVSDPEYTED
jgi:hypothetical protein